MLEELKGQYPIFLYLRQCVRGGASPAVNVAAETELVCWCARRSPSDAEFMGCNVIRMHNSVLVCVGDSSILLFAPWQQVSQMLGVKQPTPEVATVLLKYGVAAQHFCYARFLKLTR